MKKQYDFSKGAKNPYIKNLKKPVTISIDADIIIYFKNLANEKGLPYQSLINLYLKDCVVNNKEPQLNWE